MIEISGRPCYRSIYRVSESANFQQSASNRVFINFSFENYPDISIAFGIILVSRYPRVLSLEGIARALGSMNISECSINNIMYINILDNVM